MEDVKIRIAITTGIRKRTMQIARTPKGKAKTMNEIPITVKLALAVAVHDEEAVNDIIKNSVGEMTKKYLDISHEYCFEDLPFVVATMRIAARSLEMLMPESGRLFAKRIEGSTESVVVDLSELKKQMKEDPDETVDDKRTE